MVNEEGRWRPSKIPNTPSPTLLSIPIMLPLLFSLPSSAPTGQAVFISGAPLSSSKSRCSTAPSPRPCLNPEIGMGIGERKARQEENKEKRNAAR